MLRQMHSAIKTVKCHYFRNNLPCPFEELGWNFLHDSDIQENNTTSDTSLITTGSRSKVMSCSENLAFSASTPKKPGQNKSHESKKIKLQCENCTDQSQCDGCYVDEYIQKQRKDNKILSLWQLATPSPTFGH